MSENPPFLHFLLVPVLPSWFPLRGAVNSTIVENENLVEIGCREMG